MDGRHEVLGVFTTSGILCANSRGLAVPKTAVVYDAQDKDMLHSYETVASYRGYVTEIFTDPVQARAWLEG
jgi:hypothetical protein